jgi:hypothetical protein
MNIEKILNFWGAQAGIFVLFVAFAYVTLKKNVSFKSKNFEFSTLKKNVLGLIKEGMKCSEEITINKVYEMPSEQMDYVDDTVEEIYNIVMRTHVEILRKNIKVENVETHPQNIIFSNMIENILGKTKKEIRARIKKFAKKFPSDYYEDFESIELKFQEHQKHVTKILMESVKMKIQNRWIRSEEVQYSEYREAIKTAIPEIEKKVSAALRFAIDVQFKIHKTNSIIMQKVDKLAEEQDKK